jgi:hypothetical protein
MTWPLQLLTDRTGFHKRNGRTIFSLWWTVLSGNKERIFHELSFIGTNERKN